MRMYEYIPKNYAKWHSGNAVSVIVNGLCDHGRILDVHTIDDNEDLIYVIDSSNGARIYVPEEDIKGLIE